jgi:hypothetical protein
MLTMTHPMTGDRYTAEGGLVKVERNGKIGYFGPDGAHLRGELLSADPLMCVWVAPGYAKPAAISDSLKMLSMGGNIANFKDAPSHE